VWLTDILQNLFFFIDKIIFWFISALYDLFMDISNTSIFSQATIETFSNRIYVFLGVFMLFKLTFSFLSLMVNPEAISDKEKGAGKIVVRVIVTLVLIISVPSIFTMAYRVQNVILKDNTMGRIMLGISPARSANIQDTAGQEMSLDIFTAFFKPRPCNYNDDQSTCSGKLTALGGKAAEAAVMYDEVYATKDISWFSSVVNNRATFYNPATAKTEDNYVFDYTYLISTIVGGFVAYILIGFVIDIGVRTVKLGFLQLIAPIPIASYVDPKSSKDGAFSNWVKTCVSTYIDLFARLLLIYFVVFILSELNSGTGFVDMQGQAVQNPFVKVFIILGALMFAKQAPQLIKDILGIKGDAGKFELNPFKKVSSGAIGGAAIGGAVGGAVGAGAGALGGGIAGAFNTGSLKGAFAGVGRGALGGLQTGQKAGASGGNPFDAYRSGGNAAKQAATGDKSAVSGIGGFVDEKFKAANKSMDKSIAAQYDAKWENKSDNSLNMAANYEAKGDMKNANKYFDQALKYDDKINTRESNVAQSKEASKMKEFAKEVAKNMPKSK
jgi:hypothetical protein